MTGRLIPLVIALALAGCDNGQSALLPHGPEATRIASLTWILAAVCTTVLVGVTIVLLLAMRGGARTRSRLARNGTVVIGGIMLPAVVLTALLGVSSWMQAGLRAVGDNFERIEITGEQWWWRIRYQAGAEGSFASANELRIPAGRTIELTLRSADVIHSFWVPSLAGKVDMIPGRTTRLRLLADRPGVYRGQCAEYCGGPHALMALLVLVLPSAEFDAWREREAGPAREPTTVAERQGRELFLAAGCGACHAIQGTPAAGSIGPDLTHIGARRSLGADTLPMTQAGLARFVSNPQQVKPGNHMPPFGIFSRAELDHLSAYLLSLR